MVAGGGVNKTKKRLAAGEETKFKVKLKHLKRLEQKPRRPKVKIKFAATDEFGQTATAKIKVEFCHEVTLGECAGYYERAGRDGAQGADGDFNYGEASSIASRRTSGSSGQKRSTPRGRTDFCDEPCLRRDCQGPAVGDEACTATLHGEADEGRDAGGWSRTADWRVAPGETLDGTGPEMRNVTQREQVRKALADGKNVKAHVTVRAHDAAGDVATAKRTIRLVRGRPGRRSCLEWKGRLGGLSRYRVREVTTAPRSRRAAGVGRACFRRHPLRCRGTSPCGGNPGTAGSGSRILLSVGCAVDVVDFQRHV